jgi:hypothetical protein
MEEVVFETIFSWKCIKIYIYVFFNINIPKRLKNIKNNLKIKKI